MKRYTKHILFVLLLIAALLRFVNISWGAPYFFHPDERNIASSVSQLVFPTQLNPHFFAYGSLPIYVIYGTGVIVNLFSHAHDLFAVSFDTAIIVSRVYSALLSTVMIPLVFVITRKMHTHVTALLATTLTTMSVGLIQFAHFGTFEMWLTFFSLLLFYICLLYLDKPSHKLLLAIGCTLGILISVKVSSLVLLIFPFLFVLLRYIQQYKQRQRFGVLLMIVAENLIIFLTAVLVFMLTNPYVFKDFSSFAGSMNYESGVALGTLPVFYTGEFYNALPVWFQFTRIYPFLLNPLNTVIFIPAFIFYLIYALRKKSASMIFLTLFFVALFVSQAFLFAKWTRYIVPTLPFMYIILASFVVTVLAKTKFFRISIAAIIFLSGIYSLSYVGIVFMARDTRITAAEWAERHIPQSTHILSEVYDLGLMPFNDRLPNRSMQLFQFYDLDNNNVQTIDSLREELKNSSSIILPSQRILKSRLTNVQKFPNGAKFYTALLRGKLGFKKVYETPCKILCTIVYMGDPTWSFEQTATVFDRPTVMIFKKQ